MEALQAEIDNLRSEAAMMKKKFMVAMRKQQAELQGKVHTAESQVDVWRQRAEAAESTVETLRSSNETSLVTEKLQSEIEKLKADMDLSEKKRLEAEERSNSDRSELEALKKELSDARSSLSEFRSLAETSNKTLEQNEIVRVRLEEQLVSAASQISDSATRAALAGEENRSLAHKISEVQSQLSVTQAALEETSEKLRAADVAYAELESKNAQPASTPEEEPQGSSRELSEESTVDESPKQLEEMSERLAAAEGRAELVASLQTAVQSKEVELGAMEEELSRVKSELEAEKQSRSEAEGRVEGLQGQVTELQETVQSLEAKVTSLEESVRHREDKFNELDSNMKKLQKRAKQRIQELTKEKEDSEAQAVSAAESLSDALRKQASLQEELDRVCHDSAQGLRAAELDKERLRNEKSSLAEEVEELRRAVETKEMTLTESRKLATAKEQALLELSSSAQEEKERQDAIIADLTADLDKLKGSFQSQVAELQSDLEEASNTLSSLKSELSAKERAMADLEASSAAEIQQLHTGIEASRVEWANMQKQQESEKLSLQESISALEKRLEGVEKEKSQGESIARETKRLLEAEMELQRQQLSKYEEEVAAAMAEVDRVNHDLAAYKVRAAALLQKKNAELDAVKEGERVAEQQKQLEAARELVQATMAERDAVKRALEASTAEHEKEMAIQNGLLLEAEQRAREMAARQDSIRAQMAADQAEWHSRLQETEAHWRAKYSGLEERVRSSVDESLANELAALKAQHATLEKEHASWHSMVEGMMEEKDGKIQLLLDENASLQSSLAAQKQQLLQELKMNGTREQGVKSADSESAAITEEQILNLARQQAQREEEVAQCRRHIQALQDELAEMEKENRLRSQQEAMLKEELRSMERAQKRETVDMTYLKNVILKMLQTGEVLAVLPALAMLMQFSPDELKKCQEVYLNSQRDGGGDGSVSAPLSLFQVFRYGTTKG